MKPSEEIPVPKWAKIAHFFESDRILSSKKMRILLLLATCVLRSRSSCLYRAADKIDNCADIFDTKSIDYQCFIKFFSTGKGDQIIDWVFHFLVNFLFSTCADCHLILDRTNWEYGKVSKNLLCIGALYHGCFIPLIWKDLNHKGNSDTQTRLELLRRLQVKWSKSRPLPPIHIVGDREFIGDIWFRELEKMNIKFVFRLKSNLKMTFVCQDKIREKPVKIKALGRFLLQKGRTYCEVLVHGEYICQLVVLENSAAKPDEPFLYLLTNTDDPSQTGQLYRKRWLIESCFKHLKSNGFDLERQGFTAPHKIEILMSILVLVYAIAIFEGILVHQCPNKPIKMKQYKKQSHQKNDVQYPEKSVFRTGLEKLDKIVNKTSDLLKYIEKAICPKTQNSS